MNFVIESTVRKRMTRPLRIRPIHALFVVVVCIRFSSTFPTLWRAQRKSPAVKPGLRPLACFTWWFALTIIMNFIIVFP